jgi:YHS domain-containing protein
MRSSVVLLALAAVALGVLAAGCCCLGGEDQDQQDAAAAAAIAVPAAQQSVAQTRCPVMGGPINESIYADYEGRRVYFCCEGCIAAFNKDPETYLAKLDAGI